MISIAINTNSKSSLKNGFLFLSSFFSRISPNVATNTNSDYCYSVGKIVENWNLFVRNSIEFDFEWETKGKKIDTFHPLYVERVLYGVHCTGSESVLHYFHYPREFPCHSDSELKWAKKGIMVQVITRIARSNDNNIRFIHHPGSHRGRERQRASQVSQNNVKKVWFRIHNAKHADDQIDCLPE